MRARDTYVATRWSLMHAQLKSVDDLGVSILMNTLRDILLEG
jgi:hypothetical protein